MLLPGWACLTVRTAVGWGVALILASPVTAQQQPVTVTLVNSSFVRIGSVEGPPETTFATVIGAVRLPGGNIVVADAGAQVVRFFEDSGRHVRSVGRAGRGPGEFEMITWIGPCPDGRLLVTDGALSRGTILESDGTVARTVGLPPRVLFSPYLSCRTLTAALALLNRPHRTTVPGQVTRAPAFVVRLTFGSEVLDTLGRLPGSEFYRGARVRGFSPIPLGAAALAAAQGDWLYLAQNDEPRIRVLNLGTQRETTFAHGLPRTGMTTAAWEAAKTRFIDQQPLRETRELLADVLAETSPPEQQPFFVDVKVDREGRLWLRLPSAGSTASWRVLTPEGNHVATVLLPASIEPLDIGRSYLLASDRDELGVQTIRAYSFAGPLIPGT